MYLYIYLYVCIYIYMYIYILYLYITLYNSNHIHTYIQLQWVHSSCLIVSPAWCGLPSRYSHSKMRLESSSNSRIISQKRYVYACGCVHAGVCILVCSALYVYSIKYIEYSSLYSSLYSSIRPSICL